MNDFDNKFITILMFFVLCFAVLPSFSEEVVSELLTLQSDEEFVLIEVAKKYPEVHFSVLHDPNRIEIELTNSKFHKNFKFNDPEKTLFTTGLPFLKDVYIEEKQTSDNKQNVLITISLRGESLIKPKLLSTRDNIIKIAFIPEDIKIANKDQLSNEILNLYNQAVDLHTNNKLTEAEKLYSQIISKNSTFYPATFNLVQIYLNNRNYDQAILILLSLLREVQNNSQDNNVDKNILVNLFNTTGTVFYLKGKIPEAHEQFYEVLRLDPKNYQAYYNIALAHEQDKNIKEAKTNFEKVIELNPGFPDAHYHIAVLDLLARDKKGAIENFKKVLELASTSKIGELSKQELKKLDKKYYKSLQ